MPAMRPIHRTSIPHRAALGESAQEVQETRWAPAPGAYMTDGASLFRVAHALCGSVGAELFLELEDCSTLELILCPACQVGALGLRSVTPASVG